MILYVVRKVVEHEANDLLAIATTRGSAIRLAYDSARGTGRYQQIPVGPNDIYLLQNVDYPDIEIRVHQITSDELCSTF